MPIARRTLSLILVLLLLGMHVPVSMAQIDGETWTSPTYGFSVSWAGTNWEPESNATLTAVGPEHLDRLHLVDGVSSLYFEGADRYEGNLTSCVGEEANLLGEEAGVTGIEPYPLDGATRSTAAGPTAEAAAFILKLAVGSGAIELVDYVECRELIPGQAVLVITLVSETGSFETELAAAQPVIDTISLTGNQPLDPLAAYGDLIAAATVKASLAGPLTGELESGPGLLGVKRAGVDAADFYARAEFDNPTPKQELWDFGLGFRDGGDDEQFRLIVDSEGTWFFKNALGAVIATGTLVDVDAGASGSNIIEVVARGDSGYFAFNERLVTEFDLSGRSEGGDVFVGAGFFDADAVENATTPYRDFEVWSLTGLSPEGAAEPAVPLDATSFDALVRSAKTDQPLAGPTSGDLQQQVGSATVKSADVDVENFVARVVFVNPDDDTGSPWDAGLAFREQESGDHYRLTIASDGTWEFQIGLQTALAQGSIPSFHTEPGAVNSVELAVEGDSAAFAVNGRFVSALATAELHGTSDLWIGTGFHQENVTAGQAIRFDDFTVWSVGESTATVAPAVATPVIEPPPATPAVEPSFGTPAVSRDAPRQRALRLHEQNNSGVDGVAVLIEGDEMTTLSVSMRGTSGGEHVVIHRGSCAAIDNSTSFTVGEIDDKGVSKTQVNRPLTELADGSHAVAIHADTATGDEIEACGDIPGSA